MATVNNPAPGRDNKGVAKNIPSACRPQQAGADMPEEIRVTVDSFATLDASSRAVVMEMVREMLQEQFPQTGDMPQTAGARRANRK